MLTQIADGVLAHQSDFMQSNAVVVEGASGVLLIDPGIRADELAGLAASLDRPVVAGFATHPHWDHLLWHPGFGTPPRYGTELAARVIGGRLADPDWRDFVGRMLPPELVDQIPLDDLFGRITGLDAEEIPWDGPVVRIIEHSAHAPGHAALLIPERGVLVAGDMLSDIVVPILNAMSPDPVADYLAALDLLETVDAGLVIPGHGSVGDDLHARVAQDRAYVEALRDGREPDDPRLDRPGWEWVRGLHEGQAQRLTG